jgi:hypothetical protein
MEVRAAGFLAPGSPSGGPSRVCIARLVLKKSSAWMQWIFRLCPRLQWRGPRRCCTDFPVVWCGTMSICSSRAPTTRAVRTRWSRVTIAVGCEHALRQGLKTSMHDWLPMRCLLSGSGRGIRDECVREYPAWRQNLGGVHQSFALEVPFVKRPRCARLESGRRLCKTSTALGALWVKG